MKTSICSLSEAVALMTPLGMSAEPIDADNLEEAATLGALLRGAAEGLRQQCFRLIPGKTRDIETLSLYWQDKNKVELRALDLYRQHAPKAWAGIASLLVEQDRRQDR